MSLFALFLACLAWVFTVWVYKRNERRWREFEETVIPGSPSVKVREVFEDNTKSPWYAEEPIYMGRLAATKAAQAAAEADWAKVRIVGDPR